MISQDIKDTIKEIPGTIRFYFKEANEMEKIKINMNLWTTLWAITMIMNIIDLSLIKIPSWVI